MSDDAGPIVSLEDVQVYFEEGGFLERDENPVKAVDGFNLDIYPNDVVALVGESGCGKTTLGKTAIGIQRPSSGSVRFHGQDIWDARDATGTVELPYEKIRRSLQIIHQDPGSSLNPNRTVLASLSAPIKQYRPDLALDERITTVHRLLERLGMKPAEDYANRLPHELSGGEQQRIALGRVLLMQPELILADEAVSALDVSLRVEMMDLLLELRELFETSYLFISHDFANARYLAKKADGRIGIMYLGKIVEVGPVDEVLEDPKHPYTKTLVWSTPSIHPERARRENEEEPPVRTIDIPTPDDVPSGCNFHTRCPSIIPPDDIEIEQDAYNEIVDFRIALQDGELHEDLVWEDLGVDPGEESVGQETREEFVSRIYDRHFEEPLEEPHRSRIKRAIEEMSRGNDDVAVDKLREHYESVCERDVPELRDEHPVACHLYDGTRPPSNGGETTEQRTID